MCICCADVSPPVLPAGELSGTTVTLLVVSGWMVTVGAVGDSRAILDTTSGGVQDLTIDHRFEDCKEE